MSPSMIRRTSLTGACLVFLGACVTQPNIDLDNLPPEATTDDGIDYYSTDLEAEEILADGGWQWSTDEEGNRVYHLNRVRRGNSSVYYVGDIRYIPQTVIASGAGRAPVNAPPYVSLNSWPLHSSTVRGSHNSNFQTRRGRVVYLPTRNRPPVQSAPPASSSSSGSTNSGSTPTVSTPPRRPPISSPPRRTAPPAPRPERRTRPTDESRRQDR